VPILVAVSDRTSRRALRRLLTSWGAWPRVVESGAAALDELALAKGAGRPYQIVLVDGRTPDLDGFALASAIRPLPELSGLEILMVSAARRGDVALCERSGISAYLTKPFSHADLFDAIRTLLRSPSAAGKPALVTQQSLAAGRRRLRILLAEDDAVSRKLATRLLENRGHAVLSVDDGRKVLDALASGSFDLLLTDVQMAGLGGLELARAIRSAEEETGKHLPIVAMTAHAMTGDRDRILSAGIDGYVAKPIRAEKLFDAIDQASAGVPSPAREPDPSFDAPEFERVRLLGQIRGDTELLEQMVELFGEDFPPLVGSARSAIVAGNAEDLGRAAHALKSLVGNFHAEGSFQTAQRLELLASEGELAAAPEALAALELRLSALHESLLSSLRMEVPS
jgi:two-component system sensor histidine kinase/response regulator